MAKLRIFAVNLCRLLLALTFILSGYVKAIDPLGTQYKLKDYAVAMHLSAYSCCLPYGAIWCQSW